MDANRNSNTGPSTVSTTSLEALSSQLAFSPRRQRRQRHCNDDDDPGHAAQPQQTPQSRPSRSHRVRFDVCNEDEGLGLGVGPPVPSQHREHGSTVDQNGGGLSREQDQDVGDDSSLSSEDLAGPMLLQVCAVRLVLGHPLPDTLEGQQRSVSMTLFSPCFEAEARARGDREAYTDVPMRQVMKSVFFFPSKSRYYGR